MKKHKVILMLLICITIVSGVFLCGGQTVSAEERVPDIVREDGLMLFLEHDEQGREYYTADLSEFVKKIRNIKLDRVISFHGENVTLSDPQFYNGFIYYDTPVGIVIGGVFPKYVASDTEEEGRIFGKVVLPEEIDGKKVVCLNLVNYSYIKEEDQEEYYSHCGARIDNLDLSECSSLEEINVESACLKELDLSKASKLRYLDCSMNDGIQLLNLDKAHNLEYLDCSYNYEQQKELSIFLPENLQTFILIRAGLEKLEITGGENLRQLDCSYNSLKQLNLRHLKNLQEITCLDNRLTELLLYDNIREIYCDWNKLEKMDTRTFKDLEVLSCNWNKIKEIDVTQNLKLKEFDCCDNYIRKFDFSKNTELVFLSIGLDYRGLGGSWRKYFKVDLDLRNNKKLEVLKCSGMMLKSFRIGSSDCLRTLNVKSCDFGKWNSALSLSKFPNLRELDCYCCHLKKLDVRKNPELERINCWWNELDKLDLSNNPKLKELDCGKNGLTSLDLSHNKSLEKLDCYGNRLASLDLSHNKSLIRLKCSKNCLTYLDLSKNIMLQSVSCQKNNIKKIDVRNSKNLRVITCQKNNIKKIDLRNAKHIQKSLCWFDYGTTVAFYDETITVTPPVLD